MPSNTLDMGTQQFQNDNSGQVFGNNNQNGTSLSSSKPIIERGASWSYGETKLLLALWSQDMVQRQLTNSKRTRHVWEKIAERIREHGYDRTADQVRTRVFNMIAEYRRIMKNPTRERRKKCIFFDALHKIYQAKDSQSLENVIMSYGMDEHYNFDPLDFTNMEDNMDGMNGDDGNNSDNDDRNEMFVFPLSPGGFTNGNINDLNSNDDSLFDDSLTQTKRCRFDNPILNELPLNNTQLASCPSSTLDSSASALLIDRMFSHLSKETEVMREWVNLERERLAQEMARRKEEKEREERREKSFLDVLTKFQERVFSLLKQNIECPNTSCQHKSQVTSSLSTTNEINDGEK